MCISFGCKDSDEMEEIIKRKDEAAARVIEKVVEKLNLEKVMYDVIKDLELQKSLRKHKSDFLGLYSGAWLFYLIVAPKLFIFDIFIRNLDILFISFASFIVGTLVGMTFYLFDREKTLRMAEEMDKARAEMLTKLKVKKYITAGFRGSFLAGALSIFLWNLTMGSFFWCLVMGSLIIPPLIFLAILGFFVTIIFARFPQKLSAITLVTTTFEINAYIFTSVIGISIGLGLFMVKPMPTLETVVLSFISIPTLLQAANGITESYACYLAHKKRKPVPSWWLND